MLLQLNAIGFLAKDAVINSHNENKVINFTVAVNEQYKKDGEKREKTTFIDCAYWTDKTGIVPHLLKGTMVHIQGSPESKLVEPPEGKPYAKLSLKISSVNLLSSSKKNNQQ